MAASGGGNRAATRLRAAPGCDPDEAGDPLVRLSWRPAERHGSAQRVDVTKFYDGFETGRFERSPRLENDRKRWTFQRPEPGIHHRWRVMTKHRRWVSSVIGEFDGPTCDLYTVR